MTIDRRTFLKGVAVGSIAAAGIDLFDGAGGRGFGRDAVASTGAVTSLAVAKGGTPETLVRNTVKALGGMQRFVRKGDVVLLKPNIGWDRTMEMAANTNPEVVKTVARMCLEAGAKRVRVMDRPCNDPRRCYKNSGIKDAIESIGDPAATIEHMEDHKFVEREFRSGKGLPGWSYYKDVLEADRLINIPIAKHHNAARLTMSLKNIMGVLGGNRGNIHRDLDQNIVDLNTVLKFDLVVLDAVRILTGNGPQGGRLKDVRKIDTVVAGTDPVAVDSYGATLFGISGRDVPHVVLAARAGLGEIDLGKVRILKA
ncbi:MAG TPA: DUF362 domain-containing protein [Candidatus Deferrimicrobiaceae bacterium]